MVLSTDVATGDPDHAGLHNEERVEINANALKPHPTRPGYYQLGAATTVVVGSADPHLWYSRSAASKASPRPVWGHLMQLFTLRPSGTVDYYADNWLSLNPSASGEQADVAYGGQLRDRPFPRTIPGPTGYALADAMEMIDWSVNVAGWTGFDCDVTSTSDTSWNKYKVFVDAAVAWNAAHPAARPFKVIASLDGSPGTSVTTAAAADTVAALAYFLGPDGSPKSSTYVIDGRPVVCSFKAEAFGLAWWQDLQAAGRAAYANGLHFMGIFLSSAQMGNFVPAIADMLTIGPWGPGADPAFTSGVSPYRSVASSNNRRWVTPVAPQDIRPIASHGQWFREALGTAAYRGAWENRVVADAPDEIRCITVNDFDEGTQLMPSVLSGFNWMALTGWEVEKWQTGQYPPILFDCLLLAHRNQSILLPTDPSPFNPLQTQFMVPNATSTNRTMPADIVEATTFLKAAGTVTLTVGGVVTTYDAPAGVYVKTVPLRVGTVTGKVSRAGVDLFTVTSPRQVSATPIVQDATYGLVSNLSPTPDTQTTTLTHV